MLFTELVPQVYRVEEAILAIKLNFLLSAEIQIKTVKQMVFDIYLNCEE